MSWELFSYQGERSMIKECPVIENNDAVTVVKFGNTDVQFSSIAKDAKTVKVKYDNGKYSIVNHEEETDSIVDESVDATDQAKIDIKKNKKTIKKKLDDVVE